MGGATRLQGATHNPLKIIVNIFISFIGAGILGLPYAFKESGLLEGILLMVLVAVFSAKAMLLIVRCKYNILCKPTVDLKRSSSVFNESNKTKDQKWEEMKQLFSEEQDDSTEEDSYEKRLISINYGDVGYHALGRIGQLLVNCTLLVSQLGFCCAYLIFILENMSSYIPHVNKSQWLLLLLPPLFLLTLLRHLDRLAIFSFFAQVSNIFALAVVFWFDFEHVHIVKQRSHPKEFSLKGFPFFFAMAIYCYEGAGMILALEESVSQELRSRFNRFLIGTLSVVTMLYIAFGVCGYMSFGQETNEIITLNLPSENGIDFAMLVKVFLCVALFFTYPVMMFPVTGLLQAQCLDSRNSHPVLQQNLLRLLLVSLTGLIVILVPNFANLMAFVGATCCTLLAFILPGLFHWLLFRGTLTKWQFLFDVLLVLFGITGAIIGTQDALQRMISTKSASLHSPRNRAAFHTTVKS